MTLEYNADELCPFSFCRQKKRGDDIIAINTQTQVIRKSENVKKNL